MALKTGNKHWFGVFGGFFATYTILVLFNIYFNPPKEGEKIDAPDRVKLRVAGISAILSALYWIIESCPLIK